MRKDLAAKLVTISVFIAILPTGQSQTTPTTPPEVEEPPVKLERFEVTGSYIPLADIQTALPLTTIDEKAIADTGVATNVLEVLRKAAPQFSGNGNLGNSNANTDVGLTGGGSMLSFRNTQTLVLVNGRRMSYAPSLASGGLQFVDVNLIPLAAIARIEVLQDGASATYGTDAVGGVVNIILKTDFTGAETGARYAATTNTGHYSEHSFTFVGGGTAQNTAITVSAESSASDPLFQYQRGFSTPSYGTLSFAGVINTHPVGALPQFYLLNPALSAPPAGHTDLATLVAQGVYIPVNGQNLGTGQGAEQQYAFNLANYVTLLLANKRRSATLNFDHRISDHFTIFGDLIVTRTDTFSELNAQPLSPSLPASNPSNPTTQPMQVRNRFVDRPREFFYDSTSLRAILGARGEFSDRWGWEAAANQNTIHQAYTNPNVVDSTLRADAINQGLINLAARTPAPGALDAAGFFGTAWGQATTTLVTSDARVNGQLAELPAGPVGFALGTEYRIETLRQNADINSQTDTFNWDSGVAINPFERDRHVWSSFAEIRLPLVSDKQHLPLLHALDLDAAIRHERYSDTENPTVPKFSLAWRPVSDELLFRATYSRSFAAPTLYDLFGPNRADQSDTFQLNKFGGGTFVGEFNFRTGSNPDLLPSRSKNFTTGFVWSPKAVKGFSLTVDYFDIQQTDLVSSFDLGTILQDVELNGAASPYAHFVKLGGYDGAAITTAGQLSANPIDLIFADNTLTNIANMKLKGVDVKIEGSVRLASAGRLDATLAITSYKSYSYQALPSIAAVETAGLATGFNGTIPRWQSSANLSWSKGSWRFNAGWQHIPGITDPMGDGSPRAPYVIKSYDAVDVALAYTFKGAQRWLRGLTLRAGANNVANKMPPYGGGTFSGANADISTYNPIGRLLFVDAKYHF